MYFLKCKPKSFGILQTCCKIHAIFLKTCQSILHLQITHVYKITRTQNFKTKFKHTKHLKFAKIFLPNIRECVGETVRNSEIILEAFRNGGIVVTTGGAWTHMQLPVKQKMWHTPSPAKQGKHTNGCFYFCYLSLWYKVRMTMDYFENVLIDIMHKQMVSKSGMTTMDNWS